mgnify:CR=1 FL=1
MIQIDRPGARLAIEDVVELLAGTGVKIDLDYGAQLINPALGRYVVRGRASTQARRRAERLGRVMFFADPKQRASSKSII